jgi:hypothetical protein
LFWNLYIGHFKNDFTTWVADNRSAVVVFKHIINTLLVGCEVPLELEALAADGGFGFGG